MFWIPIKAFLERHESTSPYWQILLCHWYDYNWQKIEFYNYFTCQAGCIKKLLPVLGLEYN